MIIEKVINNNIISAYEKSGAEVIVMGRGIGFKKKQGEVVPADQISKIFRIKSRTLTEQFKELLANMPLERVRISDEIISHAKDHLKLKLNQSIYVTLTDHINFAIERVSQGIEPQNALLWEIKRFYPQEFQLGIYALELIHDRLGILLPEDEAGFIALHFVNAEYGTDIRDAVKFPDQMQAIVDIVERDLGILLDESSLHYERFMTHIKFLIQRIYRKELLSSEDRELSLLMQRKYPREYQCSVKVAEYIMQATGSRLSEEEIMYLAVHIRRVTTIDL
ncbi:MULTISPECIES: BglG family transcription antiterminator LicT [Blautia]|uniref:BglG family transcription antiterminator LicT n=1 Tax=Blautia TaxID=572511 RepID=UPI0018AB6ACE|nr:PRD domain-containing protein [Blautia wexlerae]MDB6460423.1 PRD domain-containing protein [Blautia wexlerae]MDB6463743.1 PRD domain-containing protein [Blautia wexlerae]MDB6467012.1 PRD domain-containing protein [Blautia wexlerae]